MYVELYANPTVDAEHPPDLKHLTDAAEPSVSAAHGDASAASAQPTASAQQNGMAPISAKQSPAAKLPQPSAQGNPQATDVAFITNNILSKVSTAEYGHYVAQLLSGEGVEGKPSCCAHKQLANECTLNAGVSGVWREWEGFGRHCGKDAGGRHRNAAQCLEKCGICKGRHGDSRAVHDVCRSSVPMSMIRRESR